MKKAEDIETYPLSPALTRRVVTYLNFFRLGIGLTLLLAWALGALVEGSLFIGTYWAPTSLVIYVVMALVLIHQSYQAGADIYRIAQNSLLLDVVAVSLLAYMFGGFSSGLSVLLLFTGTAAGVLLPFERAMYIASLATLAVIGDASIGGLVRSGQVESLISAGLFGLTLFVITALTHVLARWGRDFRLIAERQMATMTRLEQINELIIKRMRTGVLAVDRSGEIRMMNESGWFLLGSPQSSNRILADISPQLHAGLAAWTDEPRMTVEPITLEASQAEVIPQFASLPAGRDLAVLIFLEDNDVVARRAHELSAHTLAKLSTSIAHEIRNPLAAVSHSGQLLAESEALDDMDSRLVDIINKQSRRMNGIIENILQISRREKSQPEIIPIHEWLTDLSEEFSGAHPDNPFVLNAPGKQERLLVMFDRSQLHQVLWKLMENATQHQDESGGPSQFVLRLADESAAGFCVVSVEDNGKGIPADKIGDIFEPFITTRKEGTGLGLYIARQLCESNRAELTVDSRPGRTRFHIRMNLSAGDSNDLEAVPADTH